MPNLTRALRGHPAYAGGVCDCWMSGQTMVDRRVRVRIRRDFRRRCTCSSVLALLCCSRKYREMIPISFWTRALRVATSWSHTSHDRDRVCALQMESPCIDSGWIHYPVRPFSLNVSQNVFDCGLPSTVEGLLGT